MTTMSMRKIPASASWFSSRRNWKFPCRFAGRREDSAEVTLQQHMLFRDQLSLIRHMWTMLMVFQNTDQDDQRRGMKTVQLPPRRSCEKQESLPMWNIFFDINSFAIEIFLSYVPLSRAFRSLPIDLIASVDLICRTFWHWKIKRKN